MNVGINLFKVNTHFIEKSFCFREYLLHLYGIPRVWAFFFFLLKRFQNSRGPIRHPVFLLPYKYYLYTISMVTKYSETT